VEMIGKICGSKKESGVKSKNNAYHYIKKNQNKGKYE
jgi:hypothetical protein